MMSGQAGAEGEGRSVAEARWAAMKQLEASANEVDVEAVDFETLESSGEGSAKVVRVRASIGGGVEEAAEKDSDERVDEVTETVEEAIETEMGDSEEERQEPPRRARGERRQETGEWPEEPAERLREVLEEVLDGLDVDGEVEIEERDEELVGSIEGDDVGLLIGKHGQTIDAVQLICSQAAYRGFDERKRVVVDASGYRARREEMLCRQADRAASEAVRHGGPVDLDSMSAQERRVVHTHLRDDSDVETHSEGDEPYRCVVVTPL